VCVFVNWENVGVEGHGVVGVGGVVVVVGGVGEEEEADGIGWFGDRVDGGGVGGGHVGEGGGGHVGEDGGGGGRRPHFFVVAEEVSE